MELGFLFLPALSETETSIMKIVLNLIGAQM